MQFLEVLDAFFRDMRLYVIVGLILGNLFFAVWAALKAKKYEWEKLADFYGHQILPMVGGYVTIYMMLAFVPGIDAYMSNQAQSAALTPLVLALGARLAKNFTAVFGIPWPGATKE